MFILEPLMVVFMSLAAACRRRRHGDDLDALDFRDDGFIDCQSVSEAPQQGQRR